MAFFDERGRRLFAANEALALGDGGVTASSIATGLARSTINRGMQELRSARNELGSRLRRPGAGRKSAVAHQPDLLVALEKLIEDGWVSVVISADTGAFAVESVRRWWYKLGKARYPDATTLTITANCGGSNGPQVKLWKRELQCLANETGLKITVTHLPPGTSKWNRIEHRLFTFITMNWRGKPLVSHEVIVQLIGATATEKGLEVRCEIDGNLYPKGVAVSDEEMQASTSRAMNSTASGITRLLQINNRRDALISPQALSSVDGAVVGGGLGGRRCPALINLSTQGGVNPLLLKIPKLSGEASIWVKALAVARSPDLLVAPAVQVESSGSCNCGGRGPTNS